MTEAAFDDFVGLAPLDVLVVEELVVVGRGVCTAGDDVEFVGAALDIVILLPIVEYVVQDDVAGTG